MAEILIQNITLTYKAKLHFERNSQRENKAECNDQAAATSR
jgi:hypothetical protein